MFWRCGGHTSEPFVCLLDWSIERLVSTFERAIVCVEHFNLIFSRGLCLASCVRCCVLRYTSCGRSHGTANPQLAVTACVVAVWCMFTGMGGSADI